MMYVTKDALFNTNKELQYYFSCDNLEELHQKANEYEIPLHQFSNGPNRPVYNITAKEKNRLIGENAIELPNQVFIQMLTSRYEHKTQYLTFKNFIGKYQPIKNPNNSVVLDGYFFEESGEDYEFVRRKSRFYIWTVIEHNNKRFLVSDRFIVNKIGYIVTEKKWSKDNFIILEI